MADQPATALAVQAPSAPAVQAEQPLAPELVERIAQALEASTSGNTRRAYRADWACFTGWCAEAGRCAMPANPETVAGYLADLEGRGFAVSTMRRRLATLSRAHRSQRPDAPNPTAAELVRGTMRGFARKRAEGHGKGAAAVLPSHARDMAAAVAGEDARALRNRAALLLLSATAMRRSELLAVTVADLDWTDPRGVVIAIRKSKTDQAGIGREVDVALGGSPETCPVRTLRRYLAAAEISDGPVFRGIDRHGNVRATALTGRALSGIVKAAAEAAGMDAERVSPHGFRAGHVTARRAAGEDAGAVMDTTGHRSVAMVRRYDRAAKRFRRNTTAALGF